MLEDMLEGMLERLDVFHFYKEGGCDAITMSGLSLMKWYNPHAYNRPNVLIINMRRILLCSHRDATKLLQFLRERRDVLERNPFERSKFRW